jgi:hypothetical protein
VEFKFKPELKGLRMITNLHCNYRCKFCYQQNKSKKILDQMQLIDQLFPVSPKHFDYCTVMGGESTLLPNLWEYVKIGSFYSKETRLTTNGGLLDLPMAHLLYKAGLDGINVSIASIHKYNELHTPFVDVDQVIRQMELIVADAPYFRRSPRPAMNVRVNIPLCAENMTGPRMELVDMLDNFTGKGFNITMCEDILGSFSLFDNFDKIGATVKDVTDYGLVLLDYKGHQIGYYTHKNSAYNDTDLVVTPLGTWINWDGYCEAVGFNAPVK